MHRVPRSQRRGRKSGGRHARAAGLDNSNRNAEEEVDNTDEKEDEEEIKTNRRRMMRRAVNRSTADELQRIDLVQQIDHEKSLLQTIESDKTFLIERIAILKARGESSNVCFHELEEQRKNWYRGKSIVDELTLQTKSIVLAAMPPAMIDCITNSLSSASRSPPVTWM